MASNSLKKIQGIILARNYKDHPQGMVLSFIGKSEEGPFELIFDDQKPLFFIGRDSSSKQNIACERKELSLKTLLGKDVDGLYFKTQRELECTRQILKEEGIRTYESDIRPDDRFLMERFINLGVEVLGEAELSDGMWCFRNPQVRTLLKDRSHDLSIASLDIETGQDGSLYSIALAVEEQGKLSFQRVWMLDSQGRSSSNDLICFEKSEKSLLESFSLAWQKINPDFLIGWNVIGFDLFFLFEKAKSLSIDLLWGRHGEKLDCFETTSGRRIARIAGRVVIDGIWALKTNYFSFSNFKLETVAQELLGEGKDIEASGEQKIAEIERRFREDKIALAHYNLQDSLLVLRIFEKSQLVNLLLTRASLSGLPLELLHLSVPALDHLYLPHLHRRGFVAFDPLDDFMRESAPGGLVLEARPGRYENIAVLDFKSLYPSIIRTFNIDPLSYYVKTGKTLQLPSGISIAREENILGGIVGDLLGKRRLAKEQGNKELSQAVKILMNSFYGVLGSSNCRFYNYDLPTAITTSGQYILKTTKSYLESKGLKVIYGDTDSLFVQGCEKQEAQFSLVQEVNAYLQKYLSIHFEVSSHLELEFEKYYGQMFFPAARSVAASEGTKKRYVGLKENGEMDFVGMEFVRTDWTDVAHDFQYALFEHYFKGEALGDFIKQFVAALKNGDYDDRLVYTKRLSKRADEYTKNIPLHVRALLQLPKAQQNVNSISYVMELSGPVPLALAQGELDYDHYVDKQIRPLADVVLAERGESFDEIVGMKQLSLF